jgi:CSLREA domain-containing protein
MAGYNPWQIWTLEEPFSMSLLSFLRSAVLVGAFIWSLGASSAHAATFVVTNTSDDAGDACGPDCSLRQAIIAANINGEADTIVFDPTVFAVKRTITLTYDAAQHGQRLPPISQDVSIIGPNTPGSGVTIRSTTPGSGSVFHVMSGGSMVRLTNLSVAGAHTALLISGGNTTLTGCTFFDNVTSIENWSAQSGSLSDEERRLHPNRHCAVVEEFSSVTASNCTFSGSYCALYNDMGPMVLNSCTVTGSVIGIEINEGPLTLSNCLVVGNSQVNLGVTIGGAGIITRDKNTIAKGTAAEAGLDPNGVRDNGGPTPTIALVAGSIAKGAGAALLPTDQRGVARPKTAGSDVGAFQSHDTPTSPATSAS